MVIWQGGGWVSGLCLILIPGFNVRSGDIVRGNIVKRGDAITDDSKLF